MDPPRGPGGPLVRYGTPVLRRYDALLQRVSDRAAGRGHRLSALRWTDWNCLPSARGPAIGIKAAMSFPLNEFGNRVSETRRSVPSAADAGSYRQPLPGPHRFDS